LSTDEIYDSVMADASQYYDGREQDMGADVLREIERQVMLRIIDQRWREHLEEMDYLQEGINLRAMGQKDPLSEWQREGYEMFGHMMTGIAQDFVRYIMHVQVVRDDASSNTVRNVQEISSETIGTDGFASAASIGGEELDLGEAPIAQQPEAPQRPIVKDANDWSNTPRNAPCPCGSGKKYKLCHGAN
jgi:preprotein translocase subunit SecA